MKIRNLTYSLTLLAMLVLAGTAAAQGPVSGLATTTSNLQMTTTVETAVQLNMSTGSGGAMLSGRSRLSSAFWFATQRCCRHFSNLLLPPTR